MGYSRSFTQDRMSLRYQMDGQEHEMSDAEIRMIARERYITSVSPRSRESVGETCARMRASCLKLGEPHETHRAHVYESKLAFHLRRLDSFAQCGRYVDPAYVTAPYEFLQKLRWNPDKACHACRRFYVEEYGSERFEVFDPSDSPKVRSTLKALGREREQYLQCLLREIGVKLDQYEC